MILGIGHPWTMRCLMVLPFPHQKMDHPRNPLAAVGKAAQQKFYERYCAATAAEVLFCWRNQRWWCWLKLLATDKNLKHCSMLLLSLASSKLQT